MKNAYCSALFFSLTLLAPPSTWSEQTPEIATLSGQEAQNPAGLVENADATQTPEKSLGPTMDAEQIPAANTSADDRDPFPAAAETPETIPTAAARRSSTQHSWIDKVKAQRQARMEQYREAMECRRNYLEIWDHQPYETLERQREKMQEARQNRAEWREQATRVHQRWTSPHGKFIKDMHNTHRQFMEAQATAQRKQMDLFWQQQEQWISGQMPQGWNNPWYYRGY